MASKAVRILESSIVTPEAETPHHPIWLSNLDIIIYPRMYTPTIYLYRSTGDEDSTSFFSVARIKEGLAKVLVPFYQYAGMLGFDDDGRVELKCTGQGVKLLEVVCDSTIDDFGDFSPSNNLRKLLVPVTPSAEPPCPILLFQVTRFKCGGVCIGLAMHHTIADGTTAFHFVNSWAAVTRGVDLSAIIPPYIDCTNLRARSPLRIEYEHGEDATEGDNPVRLASPVSSTIVRISKEQLAKLKGTNKCMTTFLALTSHVWQCLCRARGTSATEITRLTFPVNIRNRLQPPLPPEHMGNGIWVTSVDLEVGELLSSSIDSIASKIRASMSKLDDGYLRSTIDFLEQQDDPTWSRKRLLPCHLHAISWLGLPIYEVDFGWGRPTLIHHADPPFSGCMYMMRDPDANGGVNLVLPMDASVPEFKKHFYADL